MNLLGKTIRQWQQGLRDGMVRFYPGLDLEGRAEKFVRFFESHLPKESRILDIGGGWGFYAEPLSRRGHHVTVLDVAKPNFQKAPVVLVEPGSRFPFPDKAFDASLLITVLHHMSDPLSVVREAARVTRKVIVVVEDLYHHAIGRFWTHVRDQIYNFEFLGHPSGFKKKEEWLQFFHRLGFRLREEKELYTWLAGMRILNGLLIFEVPNL